MSRTKKSIKNIAEEMYNVSKYGQEKNEGALVSQNTFYQKLLKFLKFIYDYCIGEEFDTSKMNKESYDLLCRRMVGFAREYSLSKIEMWITIEKWGDLYRFFEKEYVSEKISFLEDVIDMMLEIYKMQNNIKGNEDDKCKRMRKIISTYQILQDDYNRFYKKENGQNDKIKHIKGKDELKKRLEECRQLLNQESKDEGNKEIRSEMYDIRQALIDIYQENGEVKQAKELQDEQLKYRLESIRKRRK